MCASNVGGTGLDKGVQDAVRGLLSQWGQHLPDMVQEGLPDYRKATDSISFSLISQRIGHPLSNGYERGHRASG